MEFGEQSTGTRDEHYNLVSVLYHALHGADNCERYALDAEAADDERLAAFFREAQATQRKLADRAKELLGIGATSGAGGVRTGGVPPRSADVQGWETPPPQPRRESPGTERVDVRGRVTPEAELPPESMAGPEAAPRTAPSGVRPGTEETAPRSEEPIARSEEAAPPRPKPSRDLPGTEPIREEVPPTGARGVPPAPEEIPPERAGEIPTAEEVPPPRAEDVPSGAPSRAPTGDVQRGAATPSNPEEASQRSADVARGTDIPADEPEDVAAEERPPMTDVPQAPQSTVPLPDEDLIAETRGVPPDAPAEGEGTATPTEAPLQEPPPGGEGPQRRTR
ncbi:MAG: hypothetical protein M3305_10895 [Actinomycetota bacterium]|nr:hypothetical protein [Actinomycetota bacterium]